MIAAGQDSARTFLAQRFVLEIGEGCKNPSKSCAVSNAVVSSSTNLKELMLSIEIGMRHISQVLKVRVKLLGESAGVYQLAHIWLVDFWNALRKMRFNHMTLFANHLRLIIFLV